MSKAKPAPIPRNNRENLSPDTKRTVMILGMVILMILLALVGSLLYKTRANDNDKLIENNLLSVNGAISSYARAHKKLPDSLQQLNLSGSARQLVIKNLVSYRQTGTTAPHSALLNSVTDTSQTHPAVQGAYELCVTYQKAKNNDSNYHKNDPNYLTTYSHGTGRQCYNQTAYFNAPH